MNEQITKSGLKSEFGFTQKLIDDFLPEPQKKTNPVFKSRSPMLVWKRDDVLAVMETPEFQEAYERTKRRRESAEKGNDKKRAKTAELFDKAIAKISVKVIPAERLPRLAVESYDERQSSIHEIYRKANEDDVDSATLSRWVVNYIRHNLTNYDYALYAGKGHVGIHQEYQRYREAVLDKIAEAYPQYADECEKQKLHYWERN